MKKIVSFFVIAFLSAAGLAWAQQSESKVGARHDITELTIVADEWCPYNCDPAAEKKGFMIDIVSEILAKHGIKIDYRIVPWSRAVEDTRLGHYHAIIGAAYDDAPDFVFPTIPQGVSNFAFYKRKDNLWHFEDESSLEDVSLGVIADYSYGDATEDFNLDAYVEKYKNNFAKVQIVSGEEGLAMNMKKLRAGRIDIFAEDILVVANFLENNSGFDMVVADEEFLVSEDDNVFIAFSPVWEPAKDFAAMIDQGMQDMKASGRLQEIMAKYGLKSQQ